jgi:hypothetical protein
VLAAVWAMTLRSRAFWPIWATGFQLAAVGTVLAMVWAPPAARSAFALALGFWAYPILAAILLGSIRNRAAVLGAGAGSELADERDQDPGAHRASTR